MTTAAEARKTETIRVLLVDDHVLFRDSLARLLADEPDIEVVGRCGSVREARLALESGGVDLVLLDLELGNEQGAELLESAQEAGFSGRILVLAAAVADREVVRLMQLGAAGIFLQHGRAERLIEAVRKVTAGELWLEQTHLQLLVESLRRPQPDPTPSFNTREQQLIQGVLEGLSNKEIAGRLGIAETSVKASLHRLFRKAGVQSRSQLVRFALEEFRDKPCR
jgi:DNA-binding NarL/FixJ family response regulator